MRRYLFHAIRVHVRQGRTLFLLSALGVALGVGSVIAIQVINANALAAFSGSLQAVSGEADLTIEGRMPSFDERIYPRVLGTPGVEAAWPLWRAEIALDDRTATRLDLIGVDLFAPVRFPVTTHSAEGRPEERIAPALSRSGWVAVTPELARRMGWSEGDSFAVSSGSRRANLVVGALVDFRRMTPLADPKMIVMDVSQAQALFGVPGQIHQIDLRVAAGAPVDSVAARLRLRLGELFQVLTPEQRERQASGLLAAFRLNLTALSLISLFVGLFLVYTTIQASLQRRRAEFGLLRALGATRRQVIGLVLGEAALLGAIGTVLGVPLGWWVARENVGVVSATLTNLYLLEEISTLVLPGWLIPLAAAVGLGGALGGALGPALEATRPDARALLLTTLPHERARFLAGRLALSGLLLLVCALTWFVLFGQGWRPGGFVLGLALLVGLPLLTPLVIRVVCGRVRPGGFGWRFSVRGLSARLHRTSFAVAALAVAVSMLFGVTLLVAGFRRTVDTWIGDTLRADIYITTASWTRGRAEATMDEPLRTALAAHPGVRSSESLRQFLAWSGEHRITLSGVDLVAEEAPWRFLFAEGEPGEALRAFRTGAALIGEPLATRTGLRVGDTLAVQGPAGPVSFPVAGIVYDYTTEGGSAAIDLAVMERAFGPGPINNVALYLEAGRDPEAMAAELRVRFVDRPLLIRSQSRLRAEVLALFDQTFAVTRILQGMSLLIAICGIALTLLVQARERAPELALYRSLGARRGQIFRIFLGEGVGMGLLGLILGFGGGIALAFILSGIINRAWFGWTIRMHWPVVLLLGQAGTILVAAALASVMPAFRASNVPAGDLAREN